MGNGDLAKPWVEKGMRFVVAGSDLNILLAGRRQERADRARRCRSGVNTGRGAGKPL